MVKGLAFLNLLSGKNYYIDVLLFEFLTIPGPLLLFKLLAREFPLKDRNEFPADFFYSLCYFLVQRHPGRSTDFYFLSY